MAEVEPDQEAALRRLRAAFGFVEILRIVGHNDGLQQDDTSSPRKVSMDHRPTAVARQSGGVEALC